MKRNPRSLWTGIRNIDDNALQDLKGLFIQSLKDTITDREDLTVLNLSSCDERLDAIYVYDMDLPNELSTIEAVIASDDLSLLALDDNGLTHIKALLIEIGNDVEQVVLYKSMAPINIFGRSSFFLKKSKTRLERIDDEFLRVSTGFQLLRVKDKLLVIDLNTIEKVFGFHEIISKEAAAGIASIESIELVQNPEALHDLLDDVKYARRFTKVAKLSPVLEKGIANASIISFCKTFPTLAGKIRFNDRGDNTAVPRKSHWSIITH